MLWASLVLIGCYLLGSVPFPVIVSRIAKGIDLRQHGSGNMGAMNAARVLGKEWFPVVFGLDFAKGAAAAYVAGYLLPGMLGVDWATAAAMGAVAATVGHCFPLFAGFRGGVGLAASAGAMLLIAFPVLVVTCLSILLFWWLARNMYVGVAAAALVMPLYSWLLLHDPGATATIAVWGGLIFGVHLKDVRPWLAERTFH